jgi:7-carboxy-7-deazaguanine synthase
MKVNEIFLSIQGEGVLIGLPTIFIRLTGCNLDCKWCDTKYARTEGSELTTSEVMAEIKSKYGSCKLVCLTGGEPLIQKDSSSELLKSLIDEGYNILLETNGSVDLKPFSEIIENPSVMNSIDVKMPSSGEHVSFKIENLTLLDRWDTLKFVLADEDDYNYAKTFLDKYKPDTNIIFTVVGGTDLRWLVEKVTEDGLEVRVLPQLHKIIWHPDARGV